VGAGEIGSLQPKKMKGKRKLAKKESLQTWGRKERTHVIRHSSGPMPPSACPGSRRWVQRGREKTQSNRESRDYLRGEKGGISKTKKKKKKGESERRKRPTAVIYPERCCEKRQAAVNKLR